MEKTVIKDSFIKNGVRYFVSDRSIPFEEIPAELTDGGSLTQVKVPSLADTDRAEGFVFSSDLRAKLQRELAQAGVTDVEIGVSFRNTSGGFLKAVGARAAEDCVLESDEDAVVYGGDIDWSQRIAVSLSELLLMRKSSTQKIIYIDEKRECESTYGQMCENALRIAAGMAKEGIGKRDIVIFQIDDRKLFIESFWACMLRGAVAVPVDVPDGYMSESVGSQKLMQICRAFGRSVMLTEPEHTGEVADFIAQNSLESRAIDAQTLYQNEMLREIPEPLPADEACIYLFTSGSTGAPKGVGLSQDNVFARTLGEIQMYGLTEKVSDFNWMNLTHAAGLIWSHIRDVYLDAFQVQADTSVILRDPLRLPAYMHRFVSTTSWAPNFAYPMVAEAMDDGTDYGWDLSHATNVYAGGEMNVSRSLRLFLKKLEKYGFPERGLKPSFGMTETTSSITYHNSFSLETTSDDDRYVPVGEPMPGAMMRIADRDGNVLKKGQTGQLQVKGDQIITSYYGDPQANARSFTEDGFLITGDLAYIDGNRAVITGREKELIIINGLNYNIQDIEAIADDADGVRAGNTAVISVMENGRESVILFFTPQDEELLRENMRLSLKTLIRKIKSEIQIKGGITADHIIPVSDEDFPRSDICKKQKSGLRKAYEEGAFTSLLNALEDRNVKFAVELQLSPKAVTVQTDDPAEIDTALYDVTAESFADAYSMILDALKKYADIDPDGQVKRVIFPLRRRRSGIDLIGDAFPAVLKSLALENGALQLRAVFMDDMDDRSKSLLEQEALAADAYDEVYYENGIRYIRTYRTINAECDDRFSELAGKGSVILIAGGFGGIGCHLTEYLLERYREAGILVLGRRALDGPGRAGIGGQHSDGTLNGTGASEIGRTGSHGLPETITAAMAAGRLCYRQCDITDMQSTAAAVSSGEQELSGRVSAIFDLAARAVPKDEEHTVKYAAQNGDTELYIESSEVKLRGAQNLEQIRAERDCVMYVSGSVAADFGMVNMAAYAASNLLVRNMCMRDTSGKLRYIGFSGWNGTGMNLKKSRDEMKDFISSFNTDRNGFLQGFTPEEGIDIIDSVINSDTDICLAGIDPGAPSFAYMSDDEFAEVPEITVKDAASAEKAKACVDRVVPQLSRNTVIRIVPDAKAAGAGDYEATLKALWENALGVPDISVDDNIFDLGGTSLTVFRLVADIKEQLSAELRPVDIMTYSTVRELADFMRKNSEDKSATGGAASAGIGTGAGARGEGAASKQGASACTAGMPGGTAGSTGGSAAKKRKIRKDRRKV